MQRQLAIQRLQEQEKERQMRLEQQKQTIQMRAQMPAFALPYAQVSALPDRVHKGLNRIHIQMIIGPLCPNCLSVSDIPASTLCNKG